MTKILLSVPLLFFLDDAELEASGAAASFLVEKVVGGSRGADLGVDFFFSRQTLASMPLEASCERDGEWGR